MGSVRADSLSFAYDGGEAVLKSCSFHLQAGWAGLVGANGAGKTTLLRVLAGQVPPDTGLVSIEPTGAPVVLCPQRIDTAGDSIAAFAENQQGVAARLRGLLALQAQQLARWSSLSPGERKRWQIGAALSSDPSVLFLDEPTNHIDSNTRDLLLAALRSFMGVGLVVSHDRAVLEALTDRTIWLSEGRVDAYDAPYGQAQAIRNADARRATQERTTAKEKIKRAKKTLGDTRRRHEAAQHSMSGQRRNAKDRDARSAGAKARRALAEARLGREVARRRAASERALAKLPSPPHVDPTAASVFLEFVPAPKRQLLSLREAEICAGSHPVLNEVSVRLERQDRVRLAGANGAGKSTLLRELLSASALDPTRIFYLPQETDAHDAAELVKEVRRMPPEARGRVLSLVGRMGSDPTRLMSTALPSPGEARKLQIAIGLGRLVWLVILDEPTNHLDLPSVDRLKDALNDYPGALLLVSHDDGFADELTSTRWLIKDGQIEISER